MLTRDNMEAWRVFISLSHTGSVKQTAMEMNLNMSVASRLISDLESELGVELVSRRTRPMSLSAHGLTVLKHVEDLIEQHDRLTALTSSLTGGAHHYKFAFPISGGRDTLLDQLLDYQTIDPTIHFDMLTDCNHEDVLDGRVDIAVLPYRPHCRGLVMWNTGTIYNIPVASPDYVARCGMPEHPSDLKHHTIILRSGRNFPPTYHLMKEDKKEMFVWGDIGFTGDAFTCRSAAVAGLGICVDIGPDFCKKELLSGELIPVLNGWHRPPWDVTLIVNQRKTDDEKLMNFVQWFVKRETIDCIARWKPVLRLMGMDVDHL